MSTVSIPTVEALDGQPCANCRAPLAGDQRYCLHCGTRRADAAGTSLDALVAASAPGGIPQSPGVAIVAGQGHVQLAPAPVVPVAGAAYPVAAGGGAGYGGPPVRPAGFGGFARSNGPFISLGSLAVGVLIVGLLLGHWSAGDTQLAPAPTTTNIEVSVPGGLGSAGTVAAAPVASTPDASAASDSSDASSDDSSASDTPAASTPVEVPKDAVSAGDLTPAEIEKASKKGKAIVTSGKTVPKDDKPAGGGSDTLDIG